MFVQYKSGCLWWESKLIDYLFSEQKRRLKAQKKAEEKAAKQSEQVAQAPTKTDSSAAPKVSDDDLDPTVSCSLVLSARSFIKRLS